MALAPGSNLLHYRLVEQIGAGGMGVVWKARDTGLDRDVAIKVLPDDFSSDPSRLARFEREAKLLASLDHPGIATVHGLHEHEGVRFLAMELVPGEDLAVRIERGALPAGEAVEIARQVAHALEAAHEQGVVHRDLKPGNIRLTPQGSVRVLDFGLAKAGNAAAAPGTSPSLSPTLALAATEAGIILGTAAYMSPEQAKGRPVDRRADVWAFGAVLYEMLTGRRLFRGETVSETLAAVLLAEPAWDALPRETPAGLEALLRRCLDRDPATRLRDIGEARVALDRLAAGAPIWPGLPDGSGEAAAAPRRARLLGAAAAAAVLGILAGIAVAGMFRRDADPLPVRRFAIDVPELEMGFAGSPVLSPDGKRVAYVEAGRLFVRDLAELEPEEMTRAAGGQMPAWSPDGRSLAYQSAGKLWRIGAAGGAPEVVCELPVRGSIFSAVWDEEDRIAFATWRGGVYRVPARGGDPEEILPLDSPDEVDVHHLGLLPGGRGYLITMHYQDAETGRWRDDYSIELWDGSDRAVVMAGGPESSFGKPVYSPAGYLIYQRGKSNEGIWAVPFILESLRVTGEPVLIASDGVAPQVAGETLIYATSPARRSMQPFWIDREGGKVGPAGPLLGNVMDLSLSPSGSKLAAAIEDEDGSSHIWISDLERGVSQRLTFAPGNERNPTWSADGDEVFYNVGDPAVAKIFRVPADGSSAPVEVVDGWDPEAARDGRTLLLRRAHPQTEWDLWKADLAGAGDPEPVLDLPGRQYASLSPDGGLLAYLTADSAAYRLFLTTFPGLQGRWEIPLTDPRRAVWTDDGTELLVSDGNRALWSVAVQRSPRLAFSAPQLLFGETGSPAARRLQEFAVSPDGQRLLVVVPEIGDQPSRAIVVVQNWRATLGGSAAP